MSFKASNKLREIALSFFCVYYYYCMYVGTTTISQNSSRYHISRKACFEVSLLLYVNVVLIQCNAARYLLGRCLLLQVFIQMVTLYWHKYLKLSLLLTLKMETLYSCVYYILHCVNHNADFCILKLALAQFSVANKPKYHNRVTRLLDFRRSTPASMHMIVVNDS